MPDYRKGIVRTARNHRTKDPRRPNTISRPCWDSKCDDCYSINCYHVCHDLGNIDLTKMNIERKVGHLKI